MKDQLAAVPQALTQFLAKVNENITNPLIYLLFTLAFCVFIWGMFQYIVHADNSTERAKGNTAIVYGIIGMFIMFIAFGIVNFVGATMSDLFK